MKNVSDPEKRGYGDDPDDDELSNLMEYACGTMPSGNKSADYGRCSQDEDGAFWFTYRKSKTAKGIENSILYSSNLIDWSEYFPSGEDVSEIDHEDHFAVEVAIPPDLGSAMYFRRMVKTI